MADPPPLSWDKIPSFSKKFIWGLPLSPCSSNGAHIFGGNKVVCSPSYSQTTKNTFSTKDVKAEEKEKKEREEDLAKKPKETRQEKEKKARKKEKVEDANNDNTNKDKDKGLLTI